MKKLVSLLLALVMTLGVCTSAIAETNGDNGPLTGQDELTIEQLRAKWTSEDSEDPFKDITDETALRYVYTYFYPAKYQDGKVVTVELVSSIDSNGNFFRRVSDKAAAEEILNKYTDEIAKVVSDVQVKHGIDNRNDQVVRVAFSWVISRYKDMLNAPLLQPENGSGTSMSMTADGQYVYGDDVTSAQEYFNTYFEYKENSTQLDCKLDGVNGDGSFSNRENARTIIDGYWRLHPGAQVALNQLKITVPNGDSERFVYFWEIIVKYQEQLNNSQGGSQSHGPDTGSVTSLDDLFKNDDIATQKAKAFLNTYIVYEYKNQEYSDIHIKGTTIGTNGLFTDTAKARAAVNAYHAMVNEMEGTQNILNNLYLRVNDELWRFSRRMNYYEQLVQIAESKGDDRVKTDPLNKENSAAEMLRSTGGFTAPELGRNFTITFPRQLERGTDYNYNYQVMDGIGVLTVEMYAGNKQHWIEAGLANPEGIKYTVVLRNPTNGIYHGAAAGNGNSGVWDAWANGTITLNRYTDEMEKFNFGLAAVNTRDGFMTVNAIENYGEMMVLSVWNSNESMKEGEPVKNLVLVRIRVVDQFTYEAEAGMGEEVLPAVNVQDEARVKVTGVNNEIWNVTRGTDRLVVWPKEGTLASKFENGQIFPIGTLTIKAPEGYDALDSVIMNGEPMDEQSFENGVWTCPRFFPFQDDSKADMVSTRTFVLNWKSGSGENAKYFPETFTLCFGESSSAVGDALNKAYKDNHQGSTDTTISLQPKTNMEEDISAVGDNGINVAYDEITGGFHTTFDSKKGVPTLALLEKGMVIEPSEEITKKGTVAGFHAHPFETNNDPQNMDSSWFDGVMKGFIEEHKDANHTRTYGYPSNTVARTIPFVATNSVTHGDVTVYFAFTQAYRGKVIEWVDAQGKVLGYTFAYGRNDPFVATTQTEVKPGGEDGRPTGKPEDYNEPFAVGPDGGMFWCERYPQEGGNGQKWYFRLRVSGRQQEGGSYTVYLPYSYLGIDDAEAQRLINSGRKARIDHYVNGDGMAPETLEGTYTQWGICFKTSTFSPFVISTAAQSTSGSGGGYYYGGASTPSISAVKTAADARSATDYTSGIYGLTFRSTAAFSGFKGVQVDGKTIAAANYVAEDNGGIEVYLKAVYLRTLKDGRHTVTILSDAGSVTMNFTIGGVDSPTTFDAGIGAYVGMALASVGGMAWLGRKKR